MSWVRVWVHAVFATKYRDATLQHPVRNAVFDHIKEYALSKNLWLDSVNGYTDHAHCLISLNREISLSKTMQLIKGESSYWINKNELTKYKFSWQDDYWAVGISEKDIRNVRNYIHNQEEHHERKSFKEEIDTFVKEHGFELIKNGE